MRKRWLYVLGTFWLLSITCQATWAHGKLTPFEKEGRWGYKNTEGHIVIKPQFDMANDFSPEGVAAVVDNKGWVYINEKGETLIRPFIIDNGPDYFQEGLARFEANHQFGFFDRRGKIIINPRFDFALPFHEGLAAICMGCKEEQEGEHRSVKGGKWGYINRKGEIVIPTQFEEAGSFEKGKAQVRLKSQQVFIDKNGRIIKRDISGMKKGGEGGH